MFCGRGKVKAPLNSAKLLGCCREPAAAPSGKSGKTGARRDRRAPAFVLANAAGGQVRL
jgi:hypothetical protein